MLTYFELLALTDVHTATKNNPIKRVVIFAMLGELSYPYNY
jgi:hypothetical protein